MMDDVQGIGAMAAQQGADFQIFNELDYLLQKNQGEPDRNGCPRDGAATPPQHRPSDRQGRVRGR